MTDVQTFHVHMLHADPTSDPVSCYECAIIMAHKLRWAEARETHGGDNQIPWPVQAQLNEQLRQAWITQTQLYKPPTSNGGHRNKSSLMFEYCRNRVGQIITATELCVETDSTMTTAYNFIRDNRSMFRSTGGANYLILDEASERAAAKSGASGARIPAAAPNPPPPLPAADRTADDVSGALAAMTGQALPPPPAPTVASAPKPAFKGLPKR